MCFCAASRSTSCLQCSHRLWRPSYPGIKTTDEPGLCPGHPQGTDSPLSKDGPGPLTSPALREHHRCSQQLRATPQTWIKSSRGVDWLGGGVHSYSSCSVCTDTKTLASNVCPDPKWSASEHTSLSRPSLHFQVAQPQMALPEDAALCHPGWVLRIKLSDDAVCTWSRKHLWTLCCDLYNGQQEGTLLLILRGEDTILLLILQVQRGSEGSFRQ